MHPTSCSLFFPLHTSYHAPTGAENPVTASALQDAHVSGLSTDRQFATAYNDIRHSALPFSFL
jgi:hypothetical protein